MKKLNIAIGVASVGLAAFAAKIPVDFSQELGPVKRLNGMVNTAPIALTLYPEKDMLSATKELEIPCTRFHDASLESPGYDLIDVTRVFPLFHLDPDDERNYNFAATDDMLARCRETGSDIEYRLGESIEHSARQYKVNAPKDFAKWAEICVHIIRHYNEGWANGFRWNIRRWSIWEEPDNPPVLLPGKNAFREKYMPLYEITAKRIKREFPDLLVGGPAGCGVMSGIKLARYCKEHGAPLDFMGWDCYARDPEFLFTGAVDARRFLDELGFTKTENVIAEWHYGPESWEVIRHPEQGPAYGEELNGLESAAYAAAVLQRFQDAPVDQMFFYTGGCNLFGVYDGWRRKRLKWYVFRAFADVARGATRVAAPSKAADGWYCLASKNAEGRGHVFASALRQPGPLQLEVKGGMKPVRVRVIDRLRKLDEATDWTWKPEKGLLTVPRQLGESAVWLVEFAK